MNDYAQRRLDDEIRRADGLRDLLAASELRCQRLKAEIDRLKAEVERREKALEEAREMGGIRLNTVDSGIVCFGEFKDDDTSAEWAFATDSTPHLAAWLQEKESEDKTHG